MYLILIFLVYTAMNFTSLAAGGPLPTTHIPKNHVYKVHELAPFAANMVGQVLSCPAQAKSNTTDATHIRFIINDRVMPLTGLQGCKADKNGLCDLSTAIKGFQKRIEEVSFAAPCYGDLPYPPPLNVTTGQL